MASHVIITPHLFLPLLVALGALSYFIYARLQLESQQKAFKLKHGCQPAQSALPCRDGFGMAFLYDILGAARKHDILGFFNRLFEKYGSTYVAWSVPRVAILSNDSENMKCVLSTRFDDWAVKPVRQPATFALMGDGIFTTDSAFWAHSRAMLRPQFEKAQVADLDQFEEHMQRLLAQIPRDGSTVDLQDLFHRFTMDTSTEFLTGTSALSLSDDQAEKGKKFVDNFERSLEDAVTRNRFGKLYYMVPHFSAWRAIKHCRQAVDDWVEGALGFKHSLSADEKAKRAEGKYVFLNELAKHEEADANRIRNETLNVLLAGRDTTASLLGAMWFVLARQPEVWKKLQAEVDELDGEMPTYEKLRDMKYLKYCAQETLRLYPPVPILSKAAVRDTVLPHGGGTDGRQPLFAAKDTIFVYNMQSMMRQKRTYGPDAEVFKPERWADPSLRPGWDFLPFGGGPRVCLGQQYALTEAYYVTIRLMQTFRNIESRDKEPWTEKLTITCCSRNGTQVMLSS